MDLDGVDDGPLDPLTGEAVTYGESRSSVLTPMGEVESMGDFARGLGARRVKIALVVGGVVVLALAVLTTIS
jgi:hypothetical protein